MPRPPRLSATLSETRADLFSSISHKLKQLTTPPIPLHVGDTWLEPAVGARMQDLRVEDHPGMHRYSRPWGHPGLLAALAERHGVPAERILVTSGATGGLHAVCGALLDPGDEVLVLAPFWPLIRGIVQGTRATPVEVPFYDRTGDLQERLTEHLSERTVALYVNSPNNPTGRVLTADEIAGVAEFARRHDLWLLSDEVYEDYAYARPHVAVAPFAPERTFTARSFSKAWGMAGNRCGYVVGPPDPAPLRHARKVSTHCFYCSPTAAQLAGLRALEGGSDGRAAAREHYRRAGVAAADALGVSHPEGGTFLFLDVSSVLDNRGVIPFLERCLDEGVLLAPGSSFGEAYGGFVRICFTSAPPDEVARGVAALAGLLG